MKKGWEYKALGEVCEVINGLWKGKKEPFINVGVIRNANFTKDFTLRYDNIEWLDVEERQYSKRKLQLGDLIVEKSGGSEKQPVGRTVLFDKSEGEYSFSNFTSVLRIKGETIESKLLFYYLFYIYHRGDTKSIQKATTGIHNIEMDKYLSITIPVPPLSEQEEIVLRLDKAFEQIENMRRNAEQSLTTAQQLFQSTLSTLLTPQPHWQRKQFTDCIIKVSKQQQIKSKDYKQEGKYPIVSQEKELISGYWNNECDVFKHSKPVVVFGDHTKEVKYIDFDFVVGADGTQILMPIDTINCRFFYYSIKATPIRTLGYARHFKLLKEKNIFSPPLPEQATIVAKLDSLSAKVKQLKDNYTRTVALCDEMKQALLKEVFE